MCQTDLLSLETIFTKQNPVEENTGIPECMLKRDPFLTHQITMVNDLGNPTLLSCGLNKKTGSFHQEISEMNRNEEP